MMQNRIWFGVLLLILFTGCGDNKKNAVPLVDNLPQQSSSVLQSDDVEDDLNAKNVLDYRGLYSGALPSANGMLNEVTLQIADSTYIITEKSASGEIVRKRGKYVWNDIGTTISLIEQDERISFFVSENSLFILDKDGNRILGTDKVEYQLTKKNNK